MKFFFYIYKYGLLFIPFLLVLYVQWPSFSFHSLLPSEMIDPQKENTMEGKINPPKEKKKDNRSCRFPSYIGERDWNNYFEWVNDRILLLLLTPRTHIVPGLSLCCAKQIKQGVRQDKWHWAGMHGSLLNFPLVHHSALN